MIDFFVSLACHPECPVRWTTCCVNVARRWHWAGADATRSGYFHPHRCAGRFRNHWHQSSQRGKRWPELCHHVDQTERRCYQGSVPFFWCPRWFLLSQSENALFSVRIAGNIETKSEATDTISRNVALRNELDLFVNVLECRSFPGVPAHHKDVNIAVVRQNTEGEYAMLEHEVNKNGNKFEPTHLSCIETNSVGVSLERSRCCREHEDCHHRKLRTSGPLRIWIR